MYRSQQGQPALCTVKAKASTPRRCASTVRLSDVRPAPQALRPDDFAALLGAALAAARAALAHAADVRALVGAALRAGGAGRAEAAAAAAAGEAAVQAVADAASGRWSKLVGARCALRPTPHQGTPNCHENMITVCSGTASRCAGARAGSMS